MLHQLEDVFQIIVQYGILFMELAGVIVLLVTAVKALYIWAVKKERVQLNLAQGIALALEFKLGSEVLRTVIVREKGEMLMLGLISSTVLVGAILLFGHNIIGWFTQTELTMQLGVQGLQTLALGYICFSVTQVLQGTMRGAGETKVPMYISIITTVILRMPLAYLMAYLTRTPEWPNGQPIALFGSLLISWVMGMVLSIITYRMKFWRRKLGSLGDDM